MKSIEVKVDQDGVLTVEAVGYKGASCAKATEALEQALGLTKSMKKKPEYQRSVAEHQATGGAACKIG